jgi:tellurite resistance protein TerC
MARIAVIGGTVLLLGIALIVLPGPAFLVIPAGLAILATEFAWAKHWLTKVKNLFRKKPESVPGKPPRHFPRALEP